MRATSGCAIWWRGALRRWKGSGALGGRGRRHSTADVHAMNPPSLDPGPKQRNQSVPPKTIG
ncbi:hypothetical protein B0B51_07380 [blood disease bacterium A2-HR MARDI]|uniref:Uncharacterized protein n=2 Tax=Ralstonia syzygii subsp. celebesensis TaxID=1310168 RepID=A0A1U9VHP8_9RALS|nr:hypothetical protein B0B51_07380 [blood disease bacterium A2-HR MARDI]CCA80261.1 hypothethical protein [blood disease bacterium R229]